MLDLSCYYHLAWHRLPREGQLFLKFLILLLENTAAMHRGTKLLEQENTITATYCFKQQEEYNTREWSRYLTGRVVRQEISGMSWILDRTASRCSASAQNSTRWVPSAGELGAVDGCSGTEVQVPEETVQDCWLIKQGKYSNTALAFMFKRCGTKMQILHSNPIFLTRTEGFSFSCLH